MIRKHFLDGVAPLKVVDQIYDLYDFVPSFAVANATTDYDLKTQQSTAFKNITRAWLMIIWTDQDISIKLNATTNPSIPLPAGDSPFELRNIILISNIYITNASGNIANVKVMLV